jgi:hypothetical protein
MTEIDSDGKRHALERIGIKRTRLASRRKRSKASRSDSSIDFFGGARARKDIEVKGDPTGVVAEGDALRAPLSSISFREKLPPRDQ